MTDDEERRAIVEEVARWGGRATIEPWQFTVYDYMPKVGKSLGQASAQLRAFVADGRLRSEMITHNGRRVRAYWKPEDGPK